jgi:hsp70-interacting protein
MEKLLRWSLESSATEVSSDRPAARPDPELLSQLFGGPDESQLMKESVAVAKNPQAELSARETALDNLEMLVENLDNANNLENLKLWPDLLSLLDDGQPAVRKMACWVIGTAVQNNEKSQTNLVEKSGSLRRLLQLTESDPDPEVATKALYALSSALGHCPPAYDQFHEADGWNTLSRVLNPEQDIKLKLRGLSLVHALVHIEPVDPKLTKLRETPLIELMVVVLKDSDNFNAQEKVLQTFHALHQRQFPFTAEELVRINSARKSLLDSGSIVQEDYPFA